MNGAISLRSVAVRHLVVGFLIALLLPLAVLADAPRDRVGVHIHRAVKTPWPDAPIGAWRLWDAGVSWRDMEQRRGEIDFNRLDLWVRLAETKNAEVVYAFGVTPRWASARPDEAGAYGEGSAAEPARMEDWRNFVRAVATRYKGRIRTYEVWNEPNWKNFYTGSWETMADLTREVARIVKEIDPGARIVLPALASGDGLNRIDALLATGVAKHVDVIGYHFYTGHRPPEVMFEMTQRLKSSLERAGVRDKPIWNTEFGWLVQGAGRAIDPAIAGFSKKDPVYSEAMAASFVARAIFILESQGVSRNFFYAWDNESMGAFDPKTEKIKPSFPIALRALDRWRQGRRWHCERQLHDVFCRDASAPGMAIAWTVADEFDLSRLKGQWSSVETMDEHVVDLATFSGRDGFGPGPFLLRK
ncbi:GH39 family glycosyl hydrolase [Methyloversatilis sp.]|uniref:GH39 family glycosyl hydrolase n=1 Tax=Methyloversatilis sp. TaxID=2569862 RepID=UPI003D2E2FB5